MRTMFKQTRVLLLLYTALAGSISAKNCHIERRVRIFPGYRCFVENKIYSNFTPLHPYSCRYDCIVRNLANDYCLLWNGPCMDLIPDNDFQVIYITPSNNDENQTENHPTEHEHTPLAFKVGIPTVMWGDFVHSLTCCQGTSLAGMWMQCWITRGFIVSMASS